MFFHRIYPHKHCRARNGHWKPFLPRGRKAAERENAAQCSPFTSSTIWVTLGKEWMGWHWQPFMFFPRVGHSGLLWLLPLALSVGSAVFFSLWSCSGNSPRLCLAGTC